MARSAEEEIRRLLKQLRGKTLAVEFGARLGLKRQTYESYESGARRIPFELRATLTTEFPDLKARVKDLFDRYEQERPVAPDPKTREERTREAVITQMLKVGRKPEAEHEMRRALTTTLTDAARVWLLEELSDLETTTGRIDSGISTVQRAIDVAHEAGLHRSELRMRENLARRFTLDSDFATAHTVLDTALKYHPEAGPIWRRKAIVHWYSEAYADACACLRTARASGLSEDEIVHARGNVLAEWGLLERAYDDLTRAIDIAATTALRAYARSTRAHVLCRLDEHEKALAEFASAEEETPDNSWLHYFRALCHAKYGDHESAISGLKRALSLNGPKLNQSKRERALQLLSDYGAALDS